MIKEWQMIDIEYLILQERQETDKALANLMSGTRISK